MDLRIFTEPQQGATYHQLVEVARAAESLAFDGFFRSDHYLAMGVEGLPGPTDAWLTLAGLARETTRLRLGTLVSPVTFRLPSVLAIQVAQVDEMSGGRVELGLGSGWFEAEHTAYGIPFPPVGERFDILEEQLAIVTGLWSTPVGQTFSYHGKHFRLDGSPALPKPVQPNVPVIVGGAGKRRTPALAARYAAEFNAGFASVDDVATRFEAVRVACVEAGRDPASLVMSVAHVTVVGRDDAELRRRAAAIGREVDVVRADGFAGTPAEVIEKLHAYAAVGAQRFYLQILDLSDLDHLELIAAEVAPHLG
ncbi:MAG TPA: LLM class F420-dependent oxidoreductase [Kineosporiaceae bacterium]